MALLSHGSCICVRLPLKKKKKGYLRSSFLLIYIYIYIFFFFFFYALFKAITIWIKILVLRPRHAIMRPKSAIYISWRDDKHPLFRLVCLHFFFFFALLW